MASNIIANVRSKVGAELKRQSNRQTDMHVRRQMWYKVVDTVNNEAWKFTLDQLEEKFIELELQN
jgi:hypothetical protein